MLPAGGSLFSHTPGGAALLRTEKSIDQARRVRIAELSGGFHL